MRQPNNEDYYFLPDGRMVFTEKYHLKRGYCCGSGCRHCPFDFESVPEPKRSILQQQQKDAGPRS
ncbi:DUF5522 domain-containing protein [Rurimicrobium arvi]|uniref:Uncharacterized protein n=1 Tax=Rurimicrobium arvi TaxID=2049916 RepID=A0ABP8N195_9BACT